MNLLQLVAKQMRQRALSTWLTLLSVTLGVALAIALIIFYRESDKLFGQTEFGYDLIVGAKGSKLQLVLNSVYGLDVPPGTVNWSVYEDLLDRDVYGRYAAWAVPIAVTDSFQGHPVIATLPSLFGIDPETGEELPRGAQFEYRVGQTLEFAAGEAFHPRKFGAVLGAKAAAETGHRVGDELRVKHGASEDEEAHEHEEDWTVVGVLEPTGTSLDDAVLVPLAPSIALGEHTEGLADRARLLEEGIPAEELTNEWPEVVAAGGEQREGYVYDPESGLVYPTLPQRLWRVSGIFVASTGGYARAQLDFAINNRPEAMAASPAGEMRAFFFRFLEPIARLLLVITILVTVVAAMGILVSIYNSVSARRREIAILRSLGATRRTILALICTEAALVGLAGGVLGLIIGHLIALAGDGSVRERFGEGIDWLSVSGWEIAYLGGVVLLAVLAGLVPAMKAWSTPVAENLAAE